MRAHRTVSGDFPICLIKTSYFLIDLDYINNCLAIFKNLYQKASSVTIVLLCAMVDLLGLVGES